MKTEDRTVFTGWRTKSEWERVDARSPWRHLWPPAPTGGSTDPSV